MKSKFSIALLLFVALCTFAMGQATSSIIVKGSVKAKLNGETLIGVQVSEIDATNRVQNGTVTNEDGEYVIKIKSPNNKLTFNLLGYKKQSLAIGNARTINVTMEDAAIEMGEVTVRGVKTFGDGGFNIPKREISIAAQTLDFGDIEGLQVGSIDEALQGRIAGLDIVSNGGYPGSGSTMRIRGTSSITGSSEPLLVMNGIPYTVDKDPNFDFVNSNQEQWANMLSINPDDILEITVLKDAASTAIWGTRGANGVISIVTKKGAIGPTKVQYTYRLSGTKQPKGLNILNGDDYTMMMKQALFNAEQNETAANVPELSYNPSFSEYEEFNNNTDWIKAVSRIGVIHDHNLSISGGGERAQFRISTGFLDNKGTIIGTGMNRVTTRTSMDYTVSDRLRFSSEFSFSYSKTDNANGSILDIAYRKMPNASIYEQDANGNDTEKFYVIKRSSTLDAAQRDLQNPVALAMLGKSDNTSYSIQPTLRLTYDLMDPDVNYLRYTASFNFNVSNSKSASFTPWEVSNVAWDNSSVNAASNSSSQSAGINVDNSLSWQPRFSTRDHNLVVSVNNQIRTSSSGSQNVSSYGISSRTSHDATQEAYLSSIGSGRSSSRGISLSGRFNYSYKGKYVLSGTLNRSGSNKFGEGKRYGYFPGLSAKWIISDEPFMDFSKGIISEFSIRPSWGLSGREPSGSYLHFSRYTAYDKYIDMQAIRPVSLRLSNLQWETTSQFNYGADLRLFDNRLNIEYNGYYKRTSNMLFSNFALPQTSGFASISNINAGTMDNEGYEVNFNASRLIKYGKFTADFNMNFSNGFNKIVEIDETILKSYNKDYDFKNKTYMTRLEVGHSYGSIYGFRYLGVYKYDKYIPGEQEDAPVARDVNGRVIVDEMGNGLPMTFAYGTTSQYQFRGGDAMYADINKDGTIDELDIIYLGNSNPLVTGGFGTTLRYKDLSCNMFFNYRIGNKVVNMARMNAESMYGYDNQSIAVNWRWRKDGDETIMPRALKQAGFNSLGSDRYVEDASFLRFKYIQLNYAVPSAKLRPYKIDRLSLYLNVNNIAVFSSYTGVDPEVGTGGMGNVASDNSKTPRTRDLTFGLTVGL
jgi:TonB-linked SusC/RagA family outer membrane protein